MGLFQGLHVFVEVGEVLVCCAEEEVGGHGGLCGWFLRCDLLVGESDGLAGAYFEDGAIGRLVDGDADVGLSCFGFDLDGAVEG